MLVNVCVLNVPAPGDEFVLQTDASLLGVGLNIVRIQEKLPVAYFARQLRKAEKSYSATELEAHAVVKSVKHFSLYLYGRRCEVWTDHKALESLFTSNTLNRRLQRMAMRLQEWDLKIMYRPGGENANPDTLSRQKWFKYEIPKDILHTKEQNQASVEGANLSGGGCGEHPHKKREKE